MSAEAQGEPFEGEERIYSPTRLAGWLQEVNGPDRVRPPQLSRQQMAELSSRELLIHNDRRAVAHANIGPIKTPQLLALHEDLDEIVESNRQDSDKAKPAVLVDAYPGLGKTTAVRDYARDYYRRQILLRGETTSSGHRRVPLIYIALTGNTQIRGLNATICRFYGLPEKGDADALAARALDAVLTARTTVFVIDDIHFLVPTKANASSARMANHLKFLANTFPVTLIYVGVGVRERGILSDGKSPEEMLNAQFGRRTTALTLLPFHINDDDGRHEFRDLLKTIELQLVLADKYPGMLADDLADLLFAGSSGHFQSLMTLITRGCLRAVRTEHERLDAGLMSKVKNDAAAEHSRKEFLASMEAGLLTARPQGRRAPRRTAKTK